MSATPHVKVDLTQNLKSLRLPTIRQCYEEVARQAEREGLSYERYLHELVQRECEERQENRTAKMLRESQLSLEKSLEAFDTRRLPAKATRQMRTLLDGGFLDRAENALAYCPYKKVASVEKERKCDGVPRNLCAPPALC